MSTSEELALDILDEIGHDTTHPMPRTEALAVIVKLLDQWYKDTSYEIFNSQDPRDGDA